MENLHCPESCPHCGAHKVYLKRAYIREYYGDFGRNSKLKAIGWYCGKCSHTIDQCTVPADTVHGDIEKTHKKDELLSMSEEINILWQTLNEMCKAFHGWEWIADCEWGDYSYEDQTVETLQREVGYLIATLERISTDGKRKARATYNHLPRGEIR